MRHIHRTSPRGASGLIEFLIYNLPLPVSLTRWPGYVLIGIGQFAVYYVIFRTTVVKLNLKTPGREDDENVKLYSKAEYRQKVAQPQSVTDDIIRGLGARRIFSPSIIVLLACAWPCAIWRGLMTRN